MLACDYTNLLIGVVMVVPFIYEFSHRFRLYLKFFLYYSMVMLCSVLCIPFIIWRPGDVRNTLWVHAVGCWCLLVFLCECVCLSFYVCVCVCVCEGRGKTGYKAWLPGHSSGTTLAFNNINTLFLFSLVWSPIWGCNEMWLNYMQSSYLTLYVKLGEEVWELLCHSCSSRKTMYKSQIETFPEVMNEIR